MTTYNIKYYYNSQPTITDTEEDLDIDHPYHVLYTLLNALTVNQRKNLKNIEITSGVSDKHKSGYRFPDLPLKSLPFYKVKLSADKTTVSKGSTVKLTTTVTNVTTITKVEFYLGSTKLGEVTTAPYVFNYLTDKNGTYLVTSKVIDSDTIATVSNPINLTIN